ncbi:hypothetical protein M441DRAFT_378204 [Trichoderma asperellum CBS 433.97]|uniref:Uncharacterized protein n=1 Tax=Trichoderma asperellum (strain ATCC 204424 / CBS 433.97 / NBRC 101777) TaxID=1042311 RepID=A0A2T3YQL0_TRIA4|nr:hypothetical protein M441DRAFT_378204 [Trichoderma asperellum CBS 433.97]PTB34807.1 hypothetical protein M441DRAFT_378204 [Trichoderma asperellum CBS 433.97]
MADLLQTGATFAVTAFLSLNEYAFVTSFFTDVDLDSALLRDKIKKNKKHTTAGVR